MRVAEQFGATDTGRERRANEDALLLRPPLFVVADGMGGARAGEVAARIAIESFRQGLPAAGDAQLRRLLRERIEEANRKIHELSRRHAAQAGMGTTLTALHVGQGEVLLAHVGDSRAYLWRRGKLTQLTEDHSLVDELVRQGKLTPAQAQDHPQRSVITRALGPEPTVHVDLRTITPEPGDVFLLCSDGLTTMVDDRQVAQIIASEPSLKAAGKALLRAANEAGGRDNITVILLRLEGEPTSPNGDRRPTDQTTVLRLPKRLPGRSRKGARWSRRGVGVAVGLVVVVGLVVAALYIASQSIYFIGTNQRGLLTIYSGLPYELPAGIKLYTPYYVSGVPAALLPPSRRQHLLDNSWRSESDAGNLIHELELELGGGG